MHNVNIGSRRSHETLASLRDVENGLSRLEVKLYYNAQRDGFDALVVFFPTIVFLGVPSFTKINGSSAG